MKKDDLSFIRDPFTADVHTASLDFQEKILELKNDLSVKDLYKQFTLEKFWSGMLTAYTGIVQSDDFFHLHQLICVSVVFCLC